MICKRLRNRTPDGLKNFFKKFVYPYVGILLIGSFVLIANFAHAAENFSYLSDEMMDLEPVEVADVVTNIAPFTPNYQEDAVAVALAMKDQDYLGKPTIFETAKTEQPAPPADDRKSTITYKVENGDTLSTIGWKYGLKIATIKTINGLSSDTIKPGQSLKLPPGDLSPSYLKQLADKKKVAGASLNSGGGGFGRPTSGWSMSQGFGRTSFNPNHTGVDLNARSGLTIYASASGKVIKATRGWGGGYGNYIVISHGDGFTTLYGHMSSFSVSPGQYVNKGQVIGVMGNTGWSTGTHVHFEIRKNNVPQNPLRYL